MTDIDIEQRMDRLAARVDELEEETEQLRDRVDELEEKNEELRDELAERTDYVDEGLDYAARERAELAGRIDTLENEGGLGDDTPTPEAGEDTLYATVQTPLGDIVTLPDATAERGLSANERRARSVAKDVIDYASKVQAGYALTSSEIRTVLSAQKEDGRAYTETVRRVIDQLTTLGKDDVELNESLGDRKVVVFDEEFVRRTVSWRNARSNGVVIGTEVEGAT